jgi:hypothetical protein
MPIQHPQIIAATPPGAKRQRVGGNLRRIGRPTRLKDQPKGSFHAPVPLIVDSRPSIVPEPLSSAAWRLVIEFQRRVTFLELVEDGASPGDAGQEILGVGRSAAYEIAKEMRRHRSPDHWLSYQAVAGMERGEIGLGRATKRSSRADAFFAALGCGSFGKSYWRDALACRTRIHLGELDRERSEVIEGWSEAFDYWVHHGLLWESG